ncbi:MAG TPA: Asp-tRNA(Asn)/Glu-tRNA(Gln) amidotransferase subunit GatA [Anaerolinea thermolimosa]|mgnify:CR=1 FL=1|uniref:Glutamyl-tRNA(Gln) amidotransferase subunit A n=1 Tax=Anaerolinea thermolimosa TaxID=229919 RepID=A0A3D1JEQ3_9CHLR|nr:Asp-tRNA(Asn)/Glu-tRNA(Gln) amidotransferase subunit GatA [Anaerolinea thermolimosa]
MELCDLTARELSGLLRQRKVSAVEILESCLERIGQVDGRPGSLDAGPLTPEDEQKVHAFITLTDDRALQQAREVDRKLAAGEDPGPLAGIPFTVKDIFCVRGTRTTAASRILANYIAPYTATPVERLEASGGLMLGKVNLDEFTYGSSSESSAFQPSPRNPWNPSRVPGGSSGGSTASVAAGEAVLSLGTDTAGSIRQPAAFCGVVGLKPTYGRVSRYGLIAFASSLDCPGPIARDVTGAAMMLQAMAGPDPRDATTADLPPEDYLSQLEAGVRGLRIGLSPDYFRITFPTPDGGFEQQPLPVEIEASVRKAADLLRALGAEIIEDVPMPNTRYGIPAYFVISRVEAASNLHRYDGVKYGYRTPEPVADLHSMYRKTRGQGFGVQPKLRILMGMYVSAAQYSEQYYQRALRVRTLIRRDFETAFDPQGPYRLNALLTPTTPTSAFAMSAVYGDSVLMQYADQLTVPANHAGIPGLSIPAGLDAEGLPLGIQLLGPDFSEATLLRIARAYEQATEAEEWRTQKPAVLS